jgi:hypothetical protein
LSKKNKATNHKINKLEKNLHFECYLPGLEKRRTVETYFKIGDGSEMAILEESEFYTKNY